MSSFKRIVNIIPLTRVNLDSPQIFTYLVPLELQDQIRPGQLVEIPFGSRFIRGVTSSFEMHRLAADIKGYKPLKKIIEAVPVLSEQNLTLANWLSLYWVVSLGVVIKAMLPKFTKSERKPDTVGYEAFNPDFLLTEHQRAAVSQISNSLGISKTFLLHGVTGSGKTEVYMRIMERLLDSGKQIIMLVPEISLTPQAIERFARRFGIDRIALWHSRLKDTERLWLWRQIREKNKQIIIGPRSAIFSPVSDLGLIVIDEEHDPSYKQYDQNPKYHARTVAKKLTELWQCPLILGDATPSLETFYETAREKSAYLSLPDRIKADLGFPPVKIVDMRRELQSGNTSIFSEELKEQILQNLKNKRQIILFLNRRGADTFVLCRDCGHVLICSECEVPLVWHSSNEKLVCHQCDKRYNSPSACPVCKGRRIKGFGTGTQKIESELNDFLKENLKPGEMPEIVRMDRDSVETAEIGSKIYHDWAKGKTNILIGTQMIGKGWDVGNVGLVGVISADSSLYLPDFRSNERTFQLLTQVAGRAGRGSIPGYVVIQTYNPKNYAIQASKTHNYQAFVSKELEHRRKFNYPPFTSMIKLTVLDNDKKSVQEKIGRVYRQLLEKRDFPVEVIGPVPAFYTRIRGKFRYQIFLKIPKPSTANLYGYFQDLPGFVDIDVDPISML